MGLDNRDYLKDEAKRYGEGGGGFGGGGASFGSETPVCRNLLIITIVVFLLQMFSVRTWNQAELSTVRDKMLESYQEALLALDQGQPGTPDSAPEFTGTTQQKNQRARDLALRIEQLQGEENLTSEMLGLPNRKVSSVQNWLQLETPKVLSGQIWRLVTCAFCHDRTYIGHIIFNMLLLWMFGRRLESMYGSKEFLLFYLSGAIVASLAYMGLDLITGSPVPMIGASGAIMAIVTLYAVHFPTETIYIFFVLPVEIRWVVLMYAIYDLHPLLMQVAGEPMSDNIAHAAHLGGLAFGYLYGTRRFRLSDYVSGTETWWKARRRGLRVVSVDSEPTVSKKTQKLADEMDAILEKISEQGEASLTTAERKTLERASRELRDRRG